MGSGQGVLGMMHQGCLGGIAGFGTSQEGPGVCARVSLVGQLGLEWTQARICYTRVIWAGWLVGIGADMGQEHSRTHHCRDASVGWLGQVQTSGSWSVPYWDYFGGMAGTRLSTGEVPGHTMPGPP